MVVAQIIVGCIVGWLVGLACARIDQWWQDRSKVNETEGEQ